PSPSSSPAPHRHLHSFPTRRSSDLYESRCTSDGERAELHLAPVRSPAPVPGLAIAPGERQAALGTVGVPHLVVVVEDVELVDVVSRGRLLRSDPVLGPSGANVNFISP